MSFVKTLATLAVGFAAAKGVEKFRQAGGVTGMKDALRGASTGQGGMADQMGAMADKYGVPGGADAVRDMFAKFSGTALAGDGGNRSGSRLDDGGDDGGLRPRARNRFLI